MRAYRKERIRILTAEASLARRRFYAALSMLLIAALMVTSSSFAWMTMSSAPEVQGIQTSIAGNGALDIALMPQNGSFSHIGSGVGTSGIDSGGVASTVTANTSWGNLINLSNEIYGLQDVVFRPLEMESEQDLLIEFRNPVWGYDGRIAGLGNTFYRSHYLSSVYDYMPGFRGSRYGVRAIVDNNGDSYGYIIDLAFILNSRKDDGTNGKLLLQREGVQRVYSGGFTEVTQGGGSYLRFRDKDNGVVSASAAASYYQVLRLTFVQDLGNSEQTNGARILAHARANPATGELYLCDAEGNALTDDAQDEDPLDVILADMERNQEYQVSVVVWMDGSATNNSNLTINTDVLNTATLNLQFATDVELVPLENSQVRALETPEAQEEEAISAEVVAGGSLGSIKWGIYNGGLLLLSGSGAIPDGDAPWRGHRDDIRTVVIDPGITGIGDSAFRDFESLTSVNIPSSVTSIGSYAFSYCSRLTSVEIPSSVTSIGSWAFSYCSRLTSVEIPSSVTSIGDSAFDTRGAIREIVLGADNGSFAEKDGVLYNADQTRLIRAESGITGSFEIPETVTTIDNGAFSGCSSLTSVEIPSSVTSIGSGAFYNCSGLTSVEIPSSVTRIGEYAFSYCSRLTSVEIPSSVTSIGDSAFHGCNRLTSVSIPSSVTSIGSYAFSGCSSLTSVEIPTGVTSIGNSAFSGCSGLTSVEIPTSVTSIGSTAFLGCTNLTTIDVNEANGSYCSVDGVLLSKDMTRLVRYPEGKSDTTYTIPDSVTSIGNSAFSGCSGLTSVEIPTSVTSIGSYAFRGCNSLTSVEIPSSVTRIGDSAFYNCSGLTSVGIPSSVTRIGEYAFYGCSSLTKVYFGGTREQWYRISIAFGNERLTRATIHYNG